MNTSCNVFQGVPSALSGFMVSYKKSVVKHSMGTFGNATKSHWDFCCFDENRARLLLKKAVPKRPQALRNG
jgi:hypothetical protein